MRAYADSSFIAALYLSERGTISAIALLRKHGPGIQISEFGRIEVVNAFYQRCFRKEIVSSAVPLLVQNLDSDIEKGVLILRSLPDSVYTRSLTLTKLWTSRLGTRASDVLHVATAIEFKADTFLSFDERQLELAKAEALSCPRP